MMRGEKNKKQSNLYLSIKSTALILASKSTIPLRHILLLPLIAILFFRLCLQRVVTILAFVAIMQAVCIRVNFVMP